MTGYLKGKENGLNIRNKMFDVGKHKLKRKTTKPFYDSAPSARVINSQILITRAGRRRVLKWAPFFFSYFFFLGSTSGLMLIGSRPHDAFKCFLNVF